MKSKNERIIEKKIEGLTAIRKLLLDMTMTDDELFDHVAATVRMTEYYVREIRDENAKTSD